MMRYSAIRRTAYVPNRAGTPWRPEFQVLSFATDLNEVLGQFYKACRPSAAEYGLPIRSLNGLLHAAAPGVLAIGRGALSDGSAPWLYAQDAVPAEVVLALLNTWVMGWVPREREGELADELERVLDAVGDRPLAWEPTAVDLTAASRSDGGTELPDRRLYTLLPEQVAFRLAANTFGGGLERLGFRVVSAEQGAEAVSWPPLSYSSKDHKWRYSVFIKISTHSVPFSAPFRIHVVSGIRRWATKAPVELRGRSATVFLDTPSPWEPAARRMRLVRNTVAYDRSIGAVGWTKASPVGLLPRFDLVRSYPVAARLLEEPEAWIEGRGGIAAGVVFSNGLGEHEIGTGLMPVERRELDEWVEALLAPEFHRVPDLRLVNRRSKPRLASKASKVTDEGPQRSARVTCRREALRDALDGMTLDVEVLWQSEQTMERLVLGLRELLDLPPARTADDGALEWDDEELKIRVHGRGAGPLVEELKLPDRKNTPRSRRLAEALRERRGLVGRSIGGAEGRRGAALVEIRSAARFRKDVDPKFAVRLGLADVDRVSQFLLIDEDTDTPLATRAPMIWLDLFRQLGAVRLPAHKVGKHLAEDLQYVGIWLLTRRSDGPTRHPGERLVAVRVRPKERLPVQVWDRSRNSWVPYPDFLVQLAKGVIVEAESTDAPEDQEWASQTDLFTVGDELSDAERDLRAVLYRVRSRPTLVMLNSGNIRLACPGLANAALLRDMLIFGDTPPQRIAAFGSALRVVLVRDHSGRDESPQWYAPHPDSSNEFAGFSAGLWESSDADGANRVFASTTDYPKSAKKIPRGLRKLLPGETWRVRPSKKAWNPRLLEITVLGCVTDDVLALSECGSIECDEPADYAAITHQMRFHDDYDPLGRPLVQHWAMKAIEYLLPLADSAEVGSDD
ncbi:DUF3962 domain-containing protein [Actinospica durhamensis]|uniref:DUF3962 domain-containing protein n=1 Tax=Actinospica durhamensis TaxID=1508375 RepID=A0A941ETG6_9ACTN|nr:DUF3962 domain-containing protein [Actinospica durhamensis]MBR7836918.1 DUF3962 domain-containing protein [Actinospica durhamensis]